jgi:hypothetical protein
MAAVHMVLGTAMLSPGGLAGEAKRVEVFVI